MTIAETQRRRRLRKDDRNKNDVNIKAIRDIGNFWTTITMMNTYIGDSQCRVYSKTEDDDDDYDF